MSSNIKIGSRFTTYATVFDFLRQIISTKDTTECNSIKSRFILIVSFYFIVC